MSGFVTSCVVGTNPPSTAPQSGSASTIWTIKHTAMTPISAITIASTHLNPLFWR